MIANPAMGPKYFGYCADHNPQWFPLRRSGNAAISMGTRIGRMTGINAAKPFVPPVKSGAQETAGRFISWDRPDFLVDATRPITIAPARKRSMVLNRAFIHRMLRCSLLMTALAAAPACAE